VRDVVRKLGHIDIAMEYYVAESKRPLAKCLNDVKACDLYLGIFAWRYGYVPKGSKRSITEQEFREARNCDKEMLLFLSDREKPWPEKYKEQGVGAQSLQNLRSDIEAEYEVAYFSTPSELAIQVSTAIAKWNTPPKTPHDAFR